MAENVKTYKIVINGIDSSITQVDALKKQLDLLDSKITELQNKTIGIKANTSNVSIPASTSRGGGNTTVLTNEVALQKELNSLENESAKTNAKILATETDIYAKVQQKKMLYKEAVEDQKQMEAQTRLELNDYRNTMTGMKQHLADLKTMIQTTDLGDSDQIEKMTKEALELTNKLKEMEEAYGTFGRNVGNYANGVADGMQKVRITIGGTVREFDSAREAARTLNNELKTMAINGDTTSDAFKELQQKVLELESTMKDAKKPMDNLMDAMESVVAVASVSKGFSAFFGLDDNEIEKSIQRLVALQTALKGLQAINQQIAERQGIGKLIAPFTSGIDAATKKVLAFNTSLLGTSKASKVAAVGIKAFGVALKTAFSLGVMLLIDLAIEGVMKLADYFTKGSREAEELAKKTQEAAEAQRKAYITAAESHMEAASKLSFLYQQVLNTTDAMKKTEAVREAAKIMKQYGYEVKSLADAEAFFTKNGPAFINMIKLQANAAAVAAVRAEKFKEAFEGFMNETLPNGKMAYSLKSAATLAGEAVRQYDEVIFDMSKKQSELAKLLGLKDDLFSTKDNSKEAAKETEKAIKARIDAMEEGYEKQLALLQFSESQELKEVKKGGEAYLAIQAKYQKKREDLAKEHAKNVIKAQNDLWKEIHKLENDNIQESLENENEMLRQNEEDKLQSSSVKKNYVERQVIVTKNDKGGYDVMIEDDISYTKRLQAEYNQREQDLQKYLQDTVKLRKDTQNKITENEIKGLSAQMDAELTTLRSSYAEQDEELKKKKELGLISEEQYNAAVKKLVEERGIAEANIVQKYGLQIQKKEKDNKKELVKIDEEANDKIVSNYEEEMEKINEIDTSTSLNSVKATKERNNQVIESLIDMGSRLNNQIATLEDQLQRQDVTHEMRESIQETIDKLKELRMQAAQGISATTSGTSATTAEATEKVKLIVQSVASSIQGVMDAVNTVLDASFNAEMDELDKELDAVQQRYDEMDELAQQHADNMKSIEQQIADSQGDARARLIERYQIEKKARKDAEKEKKKAAKEEEKLKDKQEKLEKERQKRQQLMNIATATMNTGVAITMAAMTPWPASLAYIAQAIAVGAMAIAQIASATFANGGQIPNRDGGVAQGKRHRDGGIKVLGGSVEIEGGEFVTNRITTEKNVELLDFINSKKRQVSLDDLISFYGGAKVKNNIKSIRTSFAQGGQIPTLRPIDISSQLVTAMESYSNRPVVVSVQEIIDRSNDVREVQVLAGVEDV